MNPARGRVIGGSGEVMGEDGMRKIAEALTLRADDVRGSLLTLVLRVVAALGTIVYIPSVTFSIMHRLVGVVVIDTVALGAVLALAVGTRLSYRLRAVLFCTVCYVLAVGLLVTIGSISQIYLFGFSIMGVLLLGLRFGMFAVLASSLTLLALGAVGRAAPEMGIAGTSFDTGGWILITLNFTLINTALVLAIGAVLSVLTRTLAQLQVQIERMPLAYLLSDRSFQFTRWNPAAERMFGRAEAEVLGKPLASIVAPSSLAGLTASLDQLRAGAIDAVEEGDYQRSDGRTIRCEWTTIPLFDHTGAFDGALMLGEDVTDRRALETQLRQTQKMEAVGQLAGGVAHDFNNLLSVILSYTELALDELPGDASIRSELAEVHAAGLRASTLTRKLLTFSRQQVIQPKVLDLDDVIAGFDKMLRPIVGDEIELTIVRDGSLGRIRADVGSLEQILMNLVVNARDAMPTGGKITLETANVTLDEAYASSHADVTPGPYVMLAVSDTGTGMDKAMVARIFEPFFTTKEQGKGTGLGLSTVFGIVQQSGGTIWVYSELGIGTTFKIYLPRVDAALDRAQTASQPSRTGSETILLVEDEDQVREVAQGILRRAGYRVLSARNAGEALLSCEQHAGPIQLLLTDVAMPQMSGPALAKRLAGLRPEMKSLFMSGYTDDAAVRHGVIVAEVAYLQKPLTIDTLTRKVRSVLDTH